MDWNTLNDNERLVAEHAVAAFRAVAAARDQAPHGQSMARIEKAVHEHCWDLMRRIVPASASEHPEAQEQGSAASPAPAVDPSGLPTEMQPIAQRLIEMLERLQSAFDRERGSSGSTAQLRALAAVPHRDGGHHGQQLATEAGSGYSRYRRPSELHRSGTQVLAPLQPSVGRRSAGDAGGQRIPGAGFARGTLDAGHSRPVPRGLVEGTLEDIEEEGEGGVGHETWASPRMVDTREGRHNGRQRSPSMARSRKYSREFKLSAVKLVKEQGYSIADAANSLGVDHQNVRY